MPPKTRITREMIVDAAFRIVREEGYEHLSVRNIADSLGCSTQPVLYSFKTIDEIIEAVYEKADRYHSEFILPEGREDNPLLELGLNYIRFGHDEKNLFRFLFQSDKFSGKDMASLLNDPQLSQVLKVVSDELKVNKAKARNIFMSLFAAAHGMASLLANNAMAYDKKQCKKILENVFTGAVI